MNLQHLLSYVRRAVDDYDMIQEGDKIAVGLSGGKDSMTLLLALAELRRFYPNKFELAAVSISLGFEGFDMSLIAEYCSKIDVPFHLVETDIGDIIFNIRKEKNPCSLCSKMRKGALNDKIQELGFHKVALGHNRDDVIQTFLMSLFYEGRIHCFSPVTYLSRKDIYSIRPLVYVPEKEIKSFVKKESIPVVKNPCIVDGYTKRAEIKEQVLQFKKTYQSFDEKIMGAIIRSGIDRWSKEDITRDV